MTSARGDRSDQHIRREFVGRVFTAAAELLRARGYTDVDRRAIARQAGVAYPDVCAQFRCTEAHGAACARALMCDDPSVEVVREAAGETDALTPGSERTPLNPFSTEA